MFVGDHAFGELVEAALAINLGYLALERFRYRDAIKKILATAGAHLEGMPDAYKSDKAWEDLSNLAKTAGPILSLIFSTTYIKKYSIGGLIVGLR